MPPKPPPPRRNLAAEILVQMRADIVSGACKPGEALAEPALARRYGVSRGPVREAMIELERAGLVQFEPTGRTRVRTMEERDVAEIIEARVALESMGARLAAIRWSGEHSRWVEKNLTAQERAAGITEFRKLDVAMHDYIMRCSGNERLHALWQNIRWQFEMALASVDRLQGRQATELHRFAMEGHRKVLAALAAREPGIAASTMAWHITSTLEWTVPGTLDNLYLFSAYTGATDPPDWRKRGGRVAATRVRGGSKGRFLHSKGGGRFAKK
jgi:DNA-binding GntR family transcriptional regulator